MEEDSFSAMQQEAIRRVTEMQRAARARVGREEQPSQADAETQPDGMEQSVDHQHSNGSTGLLSELLGGKLDEEKALIGLLIYILYKNGADVKLLLALGYLLL